MTRRLFSAAWLAPCTLLLFASACDTAQEETMTPEAAETAVAVMEPLPEKLEVEGFQAVLASAGDVYIAGQPSREALDWLQSEGVTTVVNLRTQPEMDNRDRVPFDEAAALDSLGSRTSTSRLVAKTRPTAPRLWRASPRRSKCPRGRCCCTAPWAGEPVTCGSPTSPGTGAWS